MKPKTPLNNLKHICWIALIYISSIPAFSQKITTDAIVKILDENKSLISTKGICQGLMDDSKTKFVAVFVQLSDLKNIGDLKKKGDRRVNIILNDMNEVPNIIAYTVTGLKRESTWFFEKRDITYFSANDLEAGKTVYLKRMDLPEEHSTKGDAKFWETGYFAIEKKVSYSLNPEEEKRLKRLAKKEKNESYKATYLEMIKDLRKENYLGEYKIVARTLRKKVVAELDSFKSAFGTNYLEPFFDNFIQKNRLDVVAYEKMSFGFPILFSPQKDLIICPILLVYKDGTSKVHYFLSKQDSAGEYEYFEWSYFPVRAPKYPASYSANAFEDINKVTVWNYSFDYLKDQKFWTENVLKKKGENYLYLKKVD